jgi:uncharacterized hydrophobic protein (TIGR00341 family)
MPLRLIEMVLPADHVQEVQDLFTEHPVVDVWYDQLSETQTLIKILVSVEDSETLIDLLEKYFSPVKGFRLILLPVAASIPRMETPEEAAAKEKAAEQPAAPSPPERVSREELYSTIADSTRISRVYLVMVGLSAIVAAIGILNNNVAVVIGAMVIAPLLGPNMALALAITLGDRELAKHSLEVNALGIAAALAISILLGAVLQVDLSNPGLASRTSIGLGDVALGLAAGSAGALAFTTGAPAALIGVMVAVALLPPIVTLGLLIGSGNLEMAVGALVLLLINIICINLAGVITFRFQGIQPTTWWEASIAKRATRLAIISFGGLLAALILLILFFHRGLKY